MSNTLFIPNKLKVGYQNRPDTYTQKLAYIIYYDEKGKLRKEASWEGWRDKNITANEFDNVPTTGFILNRNGGGTRDYYYWNARAEFVRVFDPRGFEFEISIPNLLFILSETDCTRGKGLEGEFVYGWNDKNLVLLPTNSQDYKKSLSFTNKQSVKIERKNMVIGGTYTFKKDKSEVPYIYMGRLNYCPTSSYQFGKNEMKDIFAYNYYKEEMRFVVKNIADLGECINDTVSDDFADLRVKYDNSLYNLTFDKIEKVVIGPGYSQTYFNEIIDVDKLTQHEKEKNKIKDAIFIYKRSYIDDTYVLSDKKIKKDGNLLYQYKYSRQIPSNNVQHIEVFVYLNGKKFYLNQLLEFIDYRVDTKTIQELENLAIKE